MANALEGVGLGVRPPHERVVWVERGTVEPNGDRPADAVGVVVPGVQFKGKIMMTL